MKRHALFVGVDQYSDVSFRNLRHSVSDAAALAGAFGRHGYDTHILTNPKADEVLEEVERRSDGLGPGDVFLFFFAGHGFTAQTGEHLHICANDRLPFLRCNRAGIPVDLLEELTNGRGFNRAFLVDACRTDVFAGVESRGAETRDLALVTVPDARANPGTCSVLRSCDRFRPALEFDDFGHGVFTQAVLNVMDDGESCAIPFGESFVACVRERMGDILRGHGVPADQAPAFQTNGAPFPLFGDVPRPPAPSMLVVCHKCGRRRNPLDTFRCPGCQRDFCLDHQDADTFLCPACAGKARSEEAERKAAKAARKASEERARREREEAERQERERKARAEAARKAREEAERKSREWIGAQAGERKVVRVGSVDVPLRWCPPGTFTMGSPAGESGRYGDETQHRVTLTNGFWMGETPVTQELWNKAMKNNPSYFKYGDEYPVESVTWNECAQFFAALNRIAPEDGFKWGFPTEAQWEYACRAGTTGPYGGSGRLDDMGWYDGNSGGKPHPVGQRRPNGWGLFDMHGNVWEWCRDWYGDYPTKAVTDPVGPSSGSIRVYRGGSWGNRARYCRSAIRNYDGPGDGSVILGVRVALAAVQ